MNYTSHANPTTQGFGWIMLRSKDPATLAAYYKNTLQLPELRSWKDGYMLWAGQYTVVEIGPLSEQTASQPIPELLQSDMVPVYAVRSVSEFGGIKVQDSAVMDYGLVNFSMDPDGNWFGLAEAANDDAGDQPSIREDLSLPQTPFMLNRLMLRSEAPDRQRTFYQSLFGVGDDHADTSVGIGAHTHLDFVSGSPVRIDAKDRDQIQRAFIPRVYGFDSFRQRADDLKASLVNEMVFKGGRLNYHLDTEKQLFGYQERKPFDPDNQLTHCEEDRAAREAFEATLSQASS